MTEELPKHIPPVTIVPDLKDARPRALAASMRLVVRGRVFGEYRIGAGVYSKYPLSHHRTAKKAGPVVVAAFNDEVVAFCKLGLSWCKPEHRGHGLGPELLADFIMIRGGPEKHYSNNWPSKLTAQALKLHNRAHKILVARGVVKE